MSKMNLLSILGVAFVVMGNVVSVSMGFETWQAATQPILLALGVIGIHPVLD